MSNKFNYQSDVEILRMAEQERGEAIAAFFSWLFTKRDHTATAHSGDVVAAE
jgi:hypothetical protein